MQQQFERMNVMLDEISDWLERRDERIEQLLDGYDEASSSSSCKLKSGSSSKQEEYVVLKSKGEKPMAKFQPDNKDNGYIASQCPKNDGRNEFKDGFLEQMPPKQPPIKRIEYQIDDNSYKLDLLDSRTNSFEERGNDMI
ncbi:hypothetical protein CRG98_035479 [Punica granatum]|uniref:Uncharacterized protein n=1 Tax=Punica granatum TaxID=22663 RepID=A0A2I0IJF7_PUNGR|nr:hypothetical protein CRG98_035479 [Punica granatum]